MPLSRLLKPPYAIPSMAEIRAVPRNGLTVVSTFSGCGGSCLGFEWAGYEVLAASEFVPAAAETYRLNHPGVPLWTGDVRELTVDQALALAQRQAGEIDVLEGSPPCASFSTAGRGSEYWGQVKRYSDVEQRVDDLFFEFVRLLGGLRPRVFVAENVAGLTRGVAKGYFKEIHRALAEQGYIVEARMLDAQWLGVPQVRRRVIFVGVRDDLGLVPTFPDPLPYRYSIRDAIPHLGEVEVGAGGTFGEEEWRGIDEPVGTIGASPATGNGRSPSGVIRRKVANGDVVDDDVGPTMEGYAIGDEWERLRVGQASDRFFNLIRPDSDAPLPTLTASGGGLHSAPGGVASVAHPHEKRKFSIGELRRLCGFPDDFVLTGTYAQQWERLGRAVPPPMMRAVGAAVRDLLSG